MEIFSKYLMANKTYIKIKILEYQLKPKNTEFKNFEKKLILEKLIH